jgi:hypothetical protein
VPKQQLVKMYQRIGQKSYLKFKQVFIRVSKVMNETGEELPKPKIVDVFYNRSRHPISATHYDALLKMASPDQKRLIEKYYAYREVCGEKSPTVIETHKRK